VAVLLQIYAKCIAGQEEVARKRIELALADDASEVADAPPTDDGPPSEDDESEDR
jgi:hypothetical protein